MIDLEARLAAMTDDERDLFWARFTCPQDKPTEADIARQLAKLRGEAHPPRLAPARDYEPIGSLRAFNWGE